MRRVRVGVWLAAFVAGASAPAFCQVIVPPNVSGRTIPADAGVLTFQQTVASDGAFHEHLAVYHNFKLAFLASGVVCTSGPLTTVDINIDFSQFGLVDGDTILFVYTVKHLGNDGNTRSKVISLIPVVAASGGTSSPPPTSRATTEPRAMPAWMARREKDAQS
jgi:hypothetical protein